MKEWTQDEHKPYLWHNEERGVSVICYSNDHDPDIKCIWVRTLHEGEYVSNYFSYSEKAQEMLPMEMAMELVEGFKKEEGEDASND